MKLYGSLTNRLAEQAPQGSPAVGDGATLIMYSDRHAATIIEATTKRVVVQEDTAIRTDANGMSDSQSYRYERDENGRKQTFTLRRNGRFIQEGDSMRSPGYSLVIGKRDAHHDYSF